MGRLSYKTTEESLKEAFRSYGSIKTVKIIKDKEGKSRGYGFIEFKSRSEFKCKWTSNLSGLQAGGPDEDRRCAGHGRR